MLDVRGIYVAMATPFDKSGQINESVLREWIDFMIDNGVNGLFPVSTTGEYVHLSYEESCKLIDIVMSQNRGRVEVIPGATASCPENAIKLAKHAEKKGCKAVVVCPPYLYPMEQNVILAHYMQIIEAVRADVVVYNIPQFTNPIGEEIIDKLAQTNRVCAIKDSSANMKTLMNYLDSLTRQNSKIPVLTGVDETLFSALASGCAGCMTALSGIAPELNVQIYKAVQAGDYKEGLRIQRDVMRLLKTMGSLHFPYGYKLALELRGFPMGGTKQPLAAQDKYRAAMAKGIIEQELKRLLGDKMIVNRKIYPAWRQS